MTVTFELDGQPFVALNGGPMYKFTPAVSFQIDCKDQAEVNHFWDKLTEDGDPDAQQCGWCKLSVDCDAMWLAYSSRALVKDKFGVSWQVVPAAMLEMVLDKDKKKVGSMTNAMVSLLQTPCNTTNLLSRTNDIQMKMKKIDIAGLREAFERGV